MVCWLELEIVVVPDDEEPEVVARDEPDSPLGAFEGCPVGWED